MTPEKREIGSPSRHLSLFSSPTLSPSRWLVEYSGPSRCRRADCRFCPAWMDRFATESSSGRIAIRSPRNGSLNIGHRKRRANPWHIDPYFDRLGELFHSLGPSSISGVVGRERASGRLGTIGWNVWHEHDDNNRSRPVQYVIAFICSFRFATKGRRMMGE